MRDYAGKLLVRIPPELHQELARETFESSRSINQLCVEAILARSALRNYDPWKGHCRGMEGEPKVKPKQLQQDILRMGSSSTNPPGGREPAESPGFRF
ncbi:MAG: toxin-antitoxin system HicB family antitoxin [Terriglobia bacterium]